MQPVKPGSLFCWINHTSLKRTPLRSGHVELVPVVLQSFTSSLSKADTSLGGQSELVPSVSALEGAECTIVPSPSPGPPSWVLNKCHQVSWLTCVQVLVGSNLAGSALVVWFIVRLVKLNIKSISKLLHNFIFPPHSALLFCKGRKGVVLCLEW